ncbi:MAG: ABC-2 family transporter protein [Candidatus Eremiobacteraeota bacterium]|nr:ABC-2 family transporter protein [Candidatus Eremiobacteraeota bacterium]
MIASSTVVVRRPRLRLEPYIEFTKKALAREATYRFEVFTNVASLAVRLYLLKMVWTALYAHNVAPRALALHAIITYSAVALLMGLILDIDPTHLLHDKLHDGSIATDFMKPIIVPLYFFFDGMGDVLFRLALIVPSLAIALAIVRFDLPPSPLAAVAFVLTFVLGFAVGFLLNFILSCTAFWTLEITAVQLIVTWLTDLLGGAIVPLVLFPSALQHVVGFLPFASMYATPLEIYVGALPPSAYLGALALQILWIAVLGAIATVLWRQGAKRVVVQGG